MSFKGPTHAYSLKRSITHNKNRIPFLYLLINFISAKLASLLLCLKEEFTYMFIKFSNYWFVSFLC